MTPLPPMSPEEQQAYDVALERILTFAETGYRRLDLSGLGLTSLPPEIGQCAMLYDLDLGNNQLAALPPEIGECSNLSTLFLFKNKLTTIPPEIGQCVNLSTLLLMYNRLTNLPPEIGECANLSHLSIEHNQLTEVPPEIGKCAYLSALFLGYNRLTAFPPQTGQKANLYSLLLNNNQITSLPPEIGQYANLYRLSVEDNQLTALPPEIGKCVNLSALFLGQNQLAALPPEVRQCSNLGGLYLHGNPALDLPDSILGPTWPEIQGDNKPPASPKDILDFYFSRLEQGERPLNEVKLLLVGRGEVGKTSLSRALRGEAFSREQRETPGIEIEPWALACPEGDKVTVHLWDFAGQEIAHETHRYFLTERSLYVVVVDGRQDHQTEDAEYWLEHVKKYGSHKDGGSDVESPVIVVLNKSASPGAYEVEESMLRRKFPNIRAFVRTDCQPPDGGTEAMGIVALRQSIGAALSGMPDVRRMWPAPLLKVKQRLIALATAPDPAARRHFLRWRDYTTECAACGVTGAESQQSLARQLHTLGAMLYYGDDARLQDTRVLNPNWVANGLYGLLLGVKALPHAGNAGQLWAGEIDKVLEKGMEGMDRERGAALEHYPREREGVSVHGFLLELLRERELGFRFSTVAGQALYLLPGLLPLNEPMVEEYDLGAHMKGAEVRSRYVYELLPAGLLSRFIVRTHVLSERLPRWQRGVVLGWGEARALVVTESRRQRLEVYLLGGTAEERQNLAGIVRSNMKAIHNDLPEGLRGREEIDVSPPHGKYEPVRELEQLEKEGKPVQIMTAEGSLEVAVTPALEQVQPAAARREEPARPKVFVSYSHKDTAGMDVLRNYLTVLVEAGKIGVWWDGMIRAGSEWNPTIQKHLEEADLVILLMSDEFFESDYITTKELPVVLSRHAAKQAEILPVLLSHTASFFIHPELHKIQAVPSIKCTLTAVSAFPEALNAWVLVNVALKGMIQEITARQKGA